MRKVVLPFAIVGWLTLAISWVVSADLVKAPTGSTTPTAPPIAFINATNGTDQTNVSTYTMSYTTALGNANTVLVVYAVYRASVALFLTTSTYGSVTCVVAATQFNSATDIGQDMLVCPLGTSDGAAHTLTLSSSTWLDRQVTVIEYDNVLQVGLDGAAVNNTGATPLTTSYTTTATGDWLVSGSNRAISAVTGATATNRGTLFDAAAVYDSNGTVPAGSNSVTATNTDATTITTTIIALEQATVTVPCAQSTAWFARAGTLDTTHHDAYNQLICGLVSDTVWATGDVFQMYATQNTTAALLNLISSSFASTAHGTPVFTADMGYQGVNASSTVYLDTGFNPVTAAGNFSQNSAALSVRSCTNVQASGGGGTAIGADNAAFTQVSQLDLWTAAGAFDAYVNIDATATLPRATVTSALGSWTTVRAGATSLLGYHSGASLTLSNPSTASVAIPSLNLYVLSVNINGAPGAGGVPNQIAYIWAGGALTAGQVMALYNRAATYLAAIGSSC